MASSFPVEAKKRVYTVEEANRALPLVRSIVADIVRQVDAVEALRQRLSGVSTVTRRNDPLPDPYAEEHGQMQFQLDAEETKLREYMVELEQLGVELKSADGLCDFPSQRDGRDVYLCWKLGEPEVRFWHDLNSDYSHRKPV